jgi:hypothetical protein
VVRLREAGALQIGMRGTTLDAFSGLNRIGHRKGRRGAAIVSIMRKMLWANSRFTSTNFGTLMTDIANALAR